SARHASTGTHLASFVFTDVERSTRILQEFGDRYQQMLDEQRSLLRSTFTAAGSRFVQCVGEEFLAVFDSPTAAVSSAIEGQIALRAHDWGLDAGFQVRMGVHTGETAIISGEYTGVSLHLASRICDAAHGGQILLSHAASELADVPALAPASFMELGPHLLKSFDDPVRLHQVVHPHLRADFPPPRTLSALPNNLPPRLTPLIGREEEVAEVADLLTQSRLVTLTGVGGVGKTRLAVEVGAKVLASFPDGVWLCEFAAVGDADGLVETMCRALGVYRLPGASQREALIAGLRFRHCLVVLDNCEHVLEPVAELIEEILFDCPDVTLLATSREGIGADGEQIRPVPSLTTPKDAGFEAARASQAVQLFVDRAQAVRPEFELAPHNVVAVVDICRRLDGIPLAILLAASRTSSMGPLEIAARLDKRFRYLRSGRRTAVERHRTLQATVDWSYALLDEREQRLFERLSVFAGGFSLDAAEHVCGDGLGDVGDLLSALVSKSLVVLDLTGPGTRHVLLETLRQYSQDKLTDRGDEERWRDAHGHYFLALATEADRHLFLDDESIDCEATLRRELDNLRAAFGWWIMSQNVDRALRLIIALKWFDGVLRLDNEANEWADRAISLPEAERHERYASAVGLAALSAWIRGDTEMAHALIDRALAAAPDPDDPRRVNALSTLGVLRVFEGRPDDAVEVAEAIMTIAGRCGDVRSAGQWSVIRALALAYAGRRDEALQLLEESSRIIPAPLRFHEVYVRAEVLGDADPEGAIAAAEEAVDLARTYGMEFSAMLSSITAASLRGRYYDPIEALRSFIPLIEGWRRAGNHTQQWVTIRNVTEILARLGELSSAVSLITAAEVSTTSTPAYGAQLERLNAIVDRASSELDEATLAAARAQGERMTYEHAVAAVLTAIDGAIEASRSVPR
ncbi:MAG: adenylate/guanylate cyclase domain-containing protein, partial [Actinomycetota bacterium]